MSTDREAKHEQDERGCCHVSHRGRGRRQKLGCATPGEPVGSANAYRDGPSGRQSDDIRSWHRVGRRGAGRGDHRQPRSPSAVACPGLTSLVADRPPRDDRGHGRPTPSSAAADQIEFVGLFFGGQIVGGCGSAPDARPRRPRDRLLGAQGLHPSRDRDGHAASALTDHAFARPDIDRVEIHHDRANVASEGVPRALGYRLVGDRAAASSPHPSKAASISSGVSPVPNGP